MEIQSELLVLLKRQEVRSSPDQTPYQTVSEKTTSTNRDDAYSLSGESPKRKDWIYVQGITLSKKSLLFPLDL